jgi:hypothetical protein
LDLIEEAERKNVDSFETLMEEVWRVSSLRPVKGEVRLFAK